MSTYLDYEDYFREIARRNKKIRHSDDNKNFIRLNINYSELTNGLKNKVNLKDNYVLILESYEARIDDNFSDNKRNNRLGGFMIVKKPENQNQDSEAIILDQAETIVLQIFSFMKKDAESAHPLMRHLKIGSLNYAKVTGLADGAIGWAAQFDFDKSANQELKYNPDDWID